MAVSLPCEHLANTSPALVASQWFSGAKGAIWILT